MSQILRFNMLENPKRKLFTNNDNLFCFIFIFLINRKNFIFVVMSFLQGVIFNIGNICNIGSNGCGSENINEIHRLTKEEVVDTPVTFLRDVFTFKWGNDKPFKAIIETLEKVLYTLEFNIKDTRVTSNFILVSLLLTLNIFHTFS